MCVRCAACACVCVSVFTQRDTAEQISAQSVAVALGEPESDPSVFLRYRGIRASIWKQGMSQEAADEIRPNEDKYFTKSEQKE